MNPPKNLNNILLGAFVGVLGVVTFAAILMNLVARQGNSVLTRTGSLPAASAPTDASANGAVPKLDPPPVMLAPSTPMKRPTHSPPSFLAEVSGVGVDGLSVISAKDRAAVGVQLWGIDAPGINQPFGKQAHDFLAGLVANRRVNVQPIAEADSTGHVLAKVYVDGHLINEQLVRSGLAKCSVHASDVLKDAQAEAIALRRGIWGDDRAMASLNWRSNTGGPAPAFTTAVTASPSTVGRGDTVTIKAKVTATGGPVTDGIIDVEVYDASGRKMDQQYTDSLNFDPRQSRAFSYDWALSNPGTYSVKIGVFDHTWLKMYHWHETACTFVVK
jgi:endonuclease YncB( thermonuclease family)